MTDYIKREYDEWCTDCKEYDKERHCCPRWNKVIRDTVDEIRQNADARENIKGRWIPHPDKSVREFDVCTACGIGCKRREYGKNDDGTEWMTEYSFPYCPNCGAQMIRGEA